MSLVLGLEHSCPWPRDSLFSERLRFFLGLRFFCVIGLGLEPCVLDSTSGYCFVFEFVLIVCLYHFFFRNFGDLHFQGYVLFRNVYFLQSFFLEQTFAICSLRSKILLRTGTSSVIVSTHCNKPRRVSWSVLVFTLSEKNCVYLKRNW